MRRGGEGHSFWSCTCWMCVIVFRLIDRAPDYQAEWLLAGLLWLTTADEQTHHSLIASSCRDLKTTNEDWTFFFLSTSSTSPSSGRKRCGVWDVEVAFNFLVWYPLFFCRHSANLYFLRLADRLTWLNNAVSLRLHRSLGGGAKQRTKNQNQFRYMYTTEREWEW